MFLHIQNESVVNKKSVFLTNGHGSEFVFFKVIYTMVIMLLFVFFFIYICRSSSEKRTSFLRMSWLSCLPLSSAAESLWVCCAGTSSFFSVVLMRRTWTWYSTHFVRSCFLISVNLRMFLHLSFRAEHLCTQHTAQQEPQSRTWFIGLR